MAHDGVDGKPPEASEQEPSSEWTPPAKHVAADRAATRSLRTAQAIGEALTAAGIPDEPVVVDRRGPHRSIAALDRLLADALEDDGTDDGTGDVADAPADDPASDGDA